MKLNHNSKTNRNEPSRGQRCTKFLRKIYIFPCIIGNVTFFNSPRLLSSTLPLAAKACNCFTSTRIILTYSPAGNSLKCNGCIGMLKLFSTLTLCVIWSLYNHISKNTVKTVSLRQISHLGYLSTDGKPTEVYSVGFSPNKLVLSNFETFAGLKRCVGSDWFGFI